MARQTLEDKVQYRTDVEQKSSFRKKMLAAVIIGLVILAGVVFKDDIMGLLQKVVSTIKTVNISG